MRRREFIGWLGTTAAAWPIAARAQARLPVVGVLMAGAENSAENRPRIR